MSHIAVNVNMLIYTDVDDPVSVTRSRPVMGHYVYESFVLLPLNLNGLSLNIAKNI